MTVIRKLTEFSQLLDNGLMHPIHIEALTTYSGNVLHQ